MTALTNRKINSSLNHTESLEITNTIFQITLYDNTRRINAIIIILYKTDRNHIIQPNGQYWRCIMGKFYRVFKIDLDYLNEFLVVIKNFVFDARQMILQRFDIILIDKILRKGFLSLFFQTRL